MDPLKKITIIAKEPLRAGAKFTFRGEELDEHGEPLSEMISIDLVVPPLNLDSLKLLTEPLRNLKNMRDVEAMELVVTALEHALKRNYRNVPRWLIEQTLDVSNLLVLLETLMNASGFRAMGTADEKKAVAAD